MESFKETIIEFFKNFTKEFDILIGLISFVGGSLNFWIWIAPIMIWAIVVGIISAAVMIPLCEFIAQLFYRKK
ncbi:MAG: hypothetical protein J6T10_26360 [Methanobrevibacter sp.]|nr:hypothetical protein [Methanobrevibacter sp.]